MTEDDDDLVDPRLANRVEDVLEERPALELGERLGRTEAGRRAGRQDESGDGHPAVAVCVARCVVAGLEGLAPVPTTAARSRIGTPEPP